MGNLLRMDLYRLFKGKMLWVFLIIMIALAALSAFFVWYIMNDPGGVMEAASEQTANSGDTQDFNATYMELMRTLLDVDQIQLVSNSIVSGGNLLLLIVLVAALFVSSEFSHGFAKNVYSVRIKRSYCYISKVVVLFLATLILILVSIGSLLLFTHFAGVEVRASPLSDWVLWCALLLMATFTYSLLVIALFYITQNRIATIVVAVILSTLLVGSLLATGLNILLPDSGVSDFLLATCTLTVYQGVETIESFGVLKLTLTCLSYIVVAVGVGLSALHRRDI